HRFFGTAYLLAERVQPDPRAIPLRALRRRTRCQRVALPIPVCDGGARCPSILGAEMRHPLGHLCFVVFAVAALLLAATLPGPAGAAGKLNVVTATTDLAALAQEVGGDRIEVESIARGYQDPHFVEAKPTFLLKLRKADLLILVGLQLEIGWLPPLIAQCGNPKIQVAAPGYLDASQFAEILEIPTTQVTRAMGDVHPLGNPHYWLDPENGRRIARGIQLKLAEMRPVDVAYFEQRFQWFSQRLTEAEKRWDTEMKPYRGRKVVSYHRSWPNFAKRFGLDVVSY